MILYRSRPRSKSARSASDSDSPSALAHASILARSSGDIRTPMNSSPRTVGGRPRFRVSVDLSMFLFNINRGPDGSSNSHPALTTATCKEVANG